MTEPSKYPVLYHGSKGEMRVEDMPNGYLHNAARKLRARLEAEADLPEHETKVLQALEDEVVAREAAKPPPAEEPDSTDFEETT